MHKRTWMSLKCSSILFILFCWLADTNKNSLKPENTVTDLFGSHSCVFNVVNIGVWGMGGREAKVTNLAVRGTCVE